MAERKETPDVLGEILGSLTPPTEPVPPAPLAPPTPSAPKRPRAASQPKTVAAIPAPAPQPQVSLPPLFGLRTQWEHLHIIFRDYDGWRPYQRADAKIADWKQGPAIDATLAEMGEQGWELAGVANGEHGQLHAFFKRVKR